MMIAKIINAAQKAYDDCYNNMESAKNGKCLGQAGGTKATEYLSEMCIDCPYFCLGMKDASLGSLDSINDSLKDSDDMNNYESIISDEEIKQGHVKELLDKSSKPIESIESTMSFIRHGYWNDDLCCSECNSEAIDGYTSNYCPFCGAKMINA